MITFLVFIYFVDLILAVAAWEPLPIHTTTLLSLLQSLGVLIGEILGYSCTLFQ